MIFSAASVEDIRMNFVNQMRGHKHLSPPLSLTQHGTQQNLLG